MTKRRAEEALFCGIPSKRYYGSLCNLDMQLKGSAASGAVNPPSLLALLGSRCRKRPYSFVETDVQEPFFNRKPANDDRGNHASNGVMADSSRSHHDRQTSSMKKSAKKRTHDDDESQKTVQKVAKANDDKNNDSEDISYNSFQFWRIPLPAVDLSLLDAADSKSESRENVTAKDPALDAMET